MYSLYLCYLSMFIYFEEKWVCEVPVTGKVVSLKTIVDCWLTQNIYIYSAVLLIQALLIQKSR